MRVVIGKLTVSTFEHADPPAQVVCVAAVLVVAANPRGFRLESRSPNLKVGCATHPHSS